VPPISICINTQTPLVQFLDPPDGSRLPAAGREPVQLAGLREGIDYRFSPGGVTRMVYPIVRRLLREKVLREAHWIALNPHAPATVQLPDLTLHNIAIDGDRMEGYGKVKEAIWGRIHELSPPAEHDDLFWSEAFSEFAYYNRKTSELIETLDRTLDFDAFYIHDFQQLAVGHMLGTVKPKIFRWHIPFDASTIPEKWRSMLSTYLRSYDVIVVSTRGYAKSVRALDPTGKVVHQYPYVDPAEYSHPEPARIAELDQRLGIAADDVIALIVGRMDPIKGQDLAIRALEELAPEFPHLRLVLVGNGSFSGSAAGLGMSKSSLWRTHLEKMVVERGLGPRVIFTGHLGQLDLDCLFERCALTLLPSVREGFGLVAVEGWLHKRPAIISNRAGIAEIVRDGENALLFDPDHPGALAAQMRRLLDDPKGTLRTRLVRNARRTARRCSIDAAEQVESEMLAEVTTA
jgi:glycosyltransferase involved in cell wall biosynthesis